MNRRSFLASVGVAFSTTAMGATFTPAVPRIRYELFCENYNVPRFDLTEPFSVDGIVAACDRRILLTHPGAGVVANGDRRLPALNELAWDQFEGGGFVSLKSPVLTRRASQDGSPCVTCFGRGIIGKGTLCNCIGGDPCQRCSDRGLLGPLCSECKGHAWIDGDGVCERHGDGSFNAAYIAKIRTLGNAEIKIVECKPTARHSTAVPVLMFRGDHGIRGILMSMSDN